MSTTPTTVKSLIDDLKAKGWTKTAIAQGLEVPRPTLVEWDRNSIEPRNAASVRRDLERLLVLEVPKRRKVKNDRT